MPGRVQRPPFICRWLIRLASWIVPRRSRREWHTRWRSGLDNWWILVERGELLQQANSEFLRHCCRAFLNAIALRFGPESLRHFVNGPAIVLLLQASLLIALAGASGGFRATRHLVRFALDSSRKTPLYLSQDAIVSHTVPLVSAVIIAFVLVIIRRPPLHLYGWRYWSFLVAKTVLVGATVPLLWIEGAAIARSLMPPSEFRVIVTGLLFRIVFVVSFGCAVLWSFSDQRLRCPVCLQRLGLPVRIGSWASVFEPVRIELLCERGHGLLCITEEEDGERDEWTSLDETWQDLFASPK